MSDASFDAQERERRSTNTTNSSDCDAVCIDAARIYDSCGAKDCLRDLVLAFTMDGQNIISNACSVRICKASVITSTVDVEPIAYHKGYYAVDMVFYFAVTVEAYTNTAAIPATVTGLATYSKRVVLYGGTSNAKTFSSDTPIRCSSPETNCHCEAQSSLPRATVQISNPMALSAKLSNSLPSQCVVDAPACGERAECITDYFGGEIVNPTDRYVTVTLGIFTITQLIRDVQLLIPSYDFCVPRKECNSRTADPCEAFSKIDFPTDSFFPPNNGSSSCGCSKPENFDCDCAD